MSIRALNDETKGICNLCLYLFVLLVFPFLISSSVLLCCLSIIDVDLYMTMGNHLYGDSRLNGPGECG